MPYTPDRTANIETQTLTAIEYQIANPPAVTLNTGDVEIGAVEVKDGTADTRAKVGTASGAAITDPALIVADPNSLATLGATTDAPVADNTTAEGATARSSISLLKRLANLLIAIFGAVAPAGTSVTGTGTTGAGTASVSAPASGHHLRILGASGFAVGCGCTLTLLSGSTVIRTWHSTDGGTCGESNLNIKIATDTAASVVATPDGTSTATAANITTVTETDQGA